MKTSTYRELEKYIASVLEAHDDFHSVVKNVKLVIAPDDDCRYDFNGQACILNRLKIKHSWFVAASISQEAMEYLKCTICHELSHLHSMKVNKTPWFSLLNFYILFRLKNKVVEKSIEQWHEEFYADFMGCKLYGDKEVFIEKMAALNHLYPEKNKPSTHPSWLMRISFIKNGVEPTIENVTQICQNHYRNMWKKEDARNLED